MNIRLKIPHWKVLLVCWVLVIFRIWVVRLVNLVFKTIALVAIRLWCVPSETILLCIELLRASIFMLEWRGCFIFMWLDLFNLGDRNFMNIWTETLLGVIARARNMLSFCNPLLHFVIAECTHFKCFFPIETAEGWIILLFYLLRVFNSCHLHVLYQCTAVPPSDVPSSHTWWTCVFLIMLLLHHKLFPLHVIGKIDIKNLNSFLVFLSTNFSGWFPFRHWYAMHYALFILSSYLWFIHVL